MKMYREMLRRLMPIGIPLAVATFIYTLIVGGQNYFGVYTVEIAQSAIGLMPVLVYYTFTAALFALYGFSFLFRRSASDLYHSLPVSRGGMYLSVTLATATWMGATILLNALLTLGMLLVSGCPFVPVYIPMLILFFFVASMLVYGATAIGCALSGTLLTALASTGVVLFMPRFIQFIIARGVVARVPIIGWLDLGALLTPVTNIATGMVVMQSRQVFITRVVSMPNILYSMLPMALMLGLGAWLFIRRPSEAAEHGAGRGGWTVVTAGLLSVAALLLITVDSKRLVSIYGGALTAVAFLVFVVYQLIASRNVRKVVLSLPAFAVAAALALGISAGMDALVQRQLDTAPSAEQIESVVFRGWDSKYDPTTYATLRVPGVSYTSDSMKKYVAEALGEAVERIRDPESAMYSSYSQYMVIEPITLKLTDGRVIDRTIEFRNVDALNTLRAEDAFFQGAVRAFAPAESIQYLRVNAALTKTETQAIWESFVKETQALGLITDDYYRSHERLADDQGYAITKGGDQRLGAISAAGYVGDQRFYNDYDLRLETPQTTALVMRTYNAYSLADSTARMAEAVKRITSPLAMENDNVSLDLSFFNVPTGLGDPISRSVGIYLSGYNQKNNRMAETNATYAQEFANIIARGTLTDDPDGLFVCLRWYVHDSSRRSDNSEPISYLAFDAADEQQLIALMDGWDAATLTGY